MPLYLDVQGEEKPKEEDTNGDAPKVNGDATKEQDGQKETPAVQEDASVPVEAAS